MRICQSEGDPALLGKMHMILGANHPYRVVAHHFIIALTRKFVKSQ